MGSLSIIGGSAASSATEPTLSVSGRVDGGGYTVSAGARTITITAEAGATLSTTVKKASDNSTVTVTDSTTTTPDWTAPSGGTYGESVQVTVTATKGGLSSQVSFTERVAGSGGSASWVVAHDLDLTTVTDTADLTSGTTTLTVGSDSIDVTVSRVGSTNGFVRGVNGTGVLVDDNNNSNSINAGFDIGGLFAAWGIDELTNGALAVEVTLEQIDIDDNAGDGWIGVLNSTVSHNSGNSRGMRVQSLSGLTTETVSSRLGGADTQRIASQAISTEVVLTLTTWKGNAVDGQYTVGTTAPTPFTGTVYSSGTKSLGANDSAPYASDLYLVLNATLGASFYVTRLRVLQWS